MKNLSQLLAGLLASVLLSLGFLRAADSIGALLFVRATPAEAGASAEGCVLPCSWA